MTHETHPLEGALPATEDRAACGVAVRDLRLGVRGKLPQGRGTLEAESMRPGDALEVSVPSPLL